MAALVAAIHGFSGKDVDGRAEPGHDVQGATRALR